MATRKTKSSGRSGVSPALPRSAARASALVVAQEALGSVTWIWDARRDRVTWFGDLSPLLGLPAGRFSGHFADYLERVHPLDRASARQTYVDCLKGNRPTYRAEERVVWPDGTVRWLETFARARYGKNGRALELCGVVRDCTERKQAEEDLRRSQALAQQSLDKFAALFETGPVGMVVTRPRDRTIVEINDAALRLLGATREESIGATTPAIVRWAEPQRVEGLRSAILNGERVFEQRLSLTRMDGAIVDVVASGASVDLAGEPHLVLSVRDVTNENRQRRALAESEERFEKAFHSSQEAIGISRRSDSRILTINRSMEELLGAPAADIVGRTTLELNFWSDGAEMRERVLAMLAREGRIRNLEVRVRRRDGEDRICNYSADVIDIAGESHAIGFLRDITDQQRAEALARQSMARFAAVFDNSPDSISITRERDGIVLAVNDAWVQRNTIVREQVVGRTSKSTGQWFPGDRENVMAQVMSEGRVVNRLTNFKLPDGSVRQSLISVVLIDLEGEPCTVWIGRDVTELQAAQGALRESERRYRSLFQAAMDCIMVIAPDGTLLDINDVGCRSLGYTPEELRGGSFSRILDETRLRRLLPRPDAIKIERRVLRAEQDVRAKDGALRAVEFSAGGLPDGNVLVIVRDITERKHQEKLLANIARGVSAQLGESFLSSLVTHLGRELQAEYVLAGNILPGGERVRTLAYCVDGTIAPNFEYALAGSPCVSAVERRGTVAYAEKASQLFAGDPALKALGVEGYIGTSLHDSRGEAIGILVAMTRRPVKNEALWVSVLEIYAGRAAAEIERARAEAEVRELNVSLERRVRERTAEIEAANRELESFSYSVSHDLRAPLRAITGFSSILRERHGAALGEEALRLFGRVESNAKRMGQLIDDLLEFSHTGRAELAHQPLDMRSIVDAVLSDLQPGPGLAVQIGDLPGATGDSAMLRQVWENLIGNAIKFSARAAAPRIEIGGARLERGAQYYVRDNGAGFNMHYASKLFGVFQRLHPASEFDGTGVGLAIVQRVVHRHGGEVSAEGEPGRGATFRFTLPD